MGDLLENLQEKVSDQVKRSKFFPQDATRLGKTLIRLTPDLKALGIDVTTEKKKYGKVVTLERMAKIASPASQPNQDKALRGEGDAKLPTGDAKKRAISPDAKTDLGEWEITEEIGAYEYLADDE